MRLFEQLADIRKIPDMSESPTVTTSSVAESDDEINMLDLGVVQDIINSLGEPATVAENIGEAASADNVPSI